MQSKAWSLRVRQTHHSVMEVDLPFSLTVALVMDTSVTRTIQQMASSSTDQSLLLHRAGVGACVCYVADVIISQVSCVRSSWDRSQHLRLSASSPRSKPLHPPSELLLFPVPHSLRMESATAQNAGSPRCVRARMAQVLNLSRSFESPGIRVVYLTGALMCREALDVAP